ncbi:MAG: tetratricopeptide repeat protein [Myxococcota bacterium]
MPFDRANHAYDRQRLLEAAAQARARGKRRRAISLYRWVLAVERNNAELHAKLAPLLAETGQEFDAWQSFRLTAQAALREGREDKALAVYREAAQALPREIEAWQSVARVLAKRGDEQEAVEALLEGSRHFRTPYLRPQAVHLLRRARTVAPWHFETVIELAGLLGRTDQREEARMLLEGLSQRSKGRYLRRVRKAELRLDPGLATLWRFLRSGLRSEPDEVVSQDPAKGVVPLHTRRAQR